MNQEETKTLKNFIKEYDEINFNIDLMQKSIIGLSEKRDILIDRIEALKDEEQKFMATLIAKYGESAITPNKLMKILHNENSE